MAADHNSRVRLVVLFGGRSAEHDVSCVSARHVVAAVDPERYDIEPVGITRGGDWVLAEAALKALAGDRDALPESLTADGPIVDALPMLAEPKAPVDGQITVVLPILHGPMGEDGTVQGLLELADVSQQVHVEARCGCGKPATHNARLLDGRQVVTGEQVLVGDLAGAGAVTYELRCRKCWRAGTVRP